jgi:hypothetical protein
MKFYKVFVERTEWAVVFIATDGATNEIDLINFPGSVANAAKKQMEDQSIWTLGSFKVDMVEECTNRYEMELCDLIK